MLGCLAVVAFFCCLVVDWFVVSVDSVVRGLAAGCLPLEFVVLFVVMLVWVLRECGGYLVFIGWWVVLLDCCCVVPVLWRSGFVGCFVVVSEFGVCVVCICGLFGVVIVFGLHCLLFGYLWVLRFGLFWLRSCLWLLCLFPVVCLCWRIGCAWMVFCGLLVDLIVCCCSFWCLVWCCK